MDLLSVQEQRPATQSWILDFDFIIFDSGTIHLDERKEFMKCRNI
jgi:hypothetical protein